NSKIEKSLNRKHKPHYIGQFEVNRQTQGGSYVLKELDGTFIHKGVAAFRLYPYLDRDSPMPEKLSPKD
ncbi:hypothetical protein FIBSPDRAFT_678044, partial [Athelia psychrophila]